MSDKQDLCRLLFETAHDAILVMQNGLPESAWMVVDCNASAATLFACTPAELLNRSLLDFLPPLQPDGRHSSSAFGQDIEAALAGASPRFEWVYQRANGEMFSAEASLNRVEFKGNHLVQAILRDISQTKPQEPALPLTEIKPEVTKHDYTLTPVEGLETVTLLDLIDLETLQRIQETFAEATGVASIITDLDGVPITVASNFSAVCNMVRQTEKGRAQCFRSDSVLGENSRKLMKPTYQQCLSCGFADASAPIIVGGRHIANWMIGQANVMGAGTEKIANYAREIGADVEAMVSAYETIPGMPFEQFEKVLQLLWHFAREISTAGYNILALQKDIAERKQIEESLKESERRLTDIIGFLPYPTFVIDREGQVIAWNRAIEETTGVKAEDILGKGNYEYAVPLYGERRPILIDLISAPQEEVETRYSQIRREGNVVIAETHVFPRGVERYFVASASPLYDAEGNRVGAIQTLRDATEQRRAEEALRESEKKFRQIIESLPLGMHIYRLEPDGRLVFTGANPMADKLLGVDNNLFIGQTIEEAFPSLVQTEAPERYRTAAAHGTSWQTQQITYDEGGIQGAFEVYAFQTSPGNMVAAFLDITERKRLEQQIQAASERRAHQMQASTLVSQEIAETVNLKEMYDRLVTQIKEQFNLYHTQLLRYEAETETLVLEAGYGEVGKQMVAAGYRVPLGEGIIGRTAAFGLPILQADVRNDPAWQPHPLLPQTQGEMAVPIRLSQSNAQAQLIALKGFINAGFSGLILFPIDPATIVPVTKEAIAHGLPVVTQTVDLGDESQTGHVGAENHQIGYLLGVEAGTWARTHLAAGEILQLALLNHRSLPQVLQREEGIIAGIRATFGDNIQIVASETSFDPLTGFAIVQRWLQNYPALKMIVSINDGGALGAYRAVVAAGKNDPTGFFIGGIDATDEALAAIGAGGSYQATVDQSPREVGVKAVRMVVAAIAGQPYSKRILIEPTPVNRANLAEFLANRQVKSFDDDSSLSKLDLRGIKLGLSVLTLNNPFFVALANGAKEEAARLGVELVVNDPRPLLGVLAVQSNQANRLDAEDQLVLEGLAGQIAMAIEKTRLLEEANIFRQFAEATGQGFAIANLDGYLAYVNPALLHTLGKTDLKAVQGKSVLDLYPTEQQQLMNEQVLPQVMKEGQWVGEAALRSTQGKSIPIIQNIFLIRDDTGVPLYIANSVTDITIQKQAEAELEARLYELNALQRLMSREGWEAYQSAHVQTASGYLFDQEAVRPVQPKESANGSARPVPVLGAGNGHSLTRPVAVRGEVIGTLGVYDDPNHPLSPEDQEFLGQISEQVAEAMERARLLEQTQKRAVELEAVAQVSNVAATILQTDKLLQQVVDLTKRRFGLYHAHIYLLNPAQNTLNLTAGAEEVGRQMVAQGWSIPLDREQSLVARVARSRRGIIVNEVRREPDFMPNPLLPDTQSELAVPLMVGGRVTGVLDVQADKAGHFTQDDIRIMTTLADQVAVALQNASQYEQTQAALAEVKQSQDLMRSVIDATPDWIFIKDLEHRYRLVNQSYANDMHLTIEDLIGKDDLEVGFPEEIVKGNREKGIHGFWPDDDEVIESDQTKVIDVSSAIVDGQPVFQSTIKVPLRDAKGEIWGLLGFVRDITQRENLLAETERIYKAGRRLSAAADLQEIVAAVVEGVFIPVINRAVLLMFGYDPAGKIETATVVANWYSGTGVPPTPIGVSYTLNEFAGFGLLARPEPLFINDTSTYAELDPATTQLLQQLHVRSLVSLPLWVGSRQIGAFNLLSEDPYEYSDQEMRFDISLSDQAAVAVENVRLLKETQAALAEVEATQRRYTVQSWEAYRAKKTRLNYEHVREGVEPPGESLPSEISQAQTADNQPHLSDGGQWSVISGQEHRTDSSLVVPLMVRSETIGVLGLQETARPRSWSPEEVALVEAIAEQFAQAAEGLRLVDETQRRAARERRVNEINEKIQAAQSLEEALKITIKEVGLSLQSPQTTVKLGI